MALPEMNTSPSQGQRAGDGCFLRGDDPWDLSTAVVESLHCLTLHIVQAACPYPPDGKGCVPDPALLTSMASRSNSRTFAQCGWGSSALPAWRLSSQGLGMFANATQRNIQVHAAELGARFRPKKDAGYPMLWRGSGGEVSSGGGRGNGRQNLPPLPHGLSPHFQIYSPEEPFWLWPSTCSCPCCARGDPAEQVQAFVVSTVFLSGAL